MSEVRFSIFKDEHYIDLTIMQYGFEQCKPLHSFGPYVRNNYLFIMLFQERERCVPMTRRTRCRNTRLKEVPGS